MPVPHTQQTVDASAMLIIVALASAGGYADAATYLLAGSFTGHVTGNIILAAISFAAADYRLLGVRLLAIALFLFATGVGLLLTRKKRQPQRTLIAALLLEAILMAIAPIGSFLHNPHASLLLIACLCLALGLQNGVFSKSGGVSVHATYITGDITTLLKGFLPKANPDSPDDSSQRAAARVVLGLTWFGFTAGALLAVPGIHRCGVYALWFLELPVLIAAVATAASILRSLNEPECDNI